MTELLSNKKLKISVVMPFYNREKYIAQTIESVLNQTFTDFEFIAIDDGSTDTSVEIVQQYADKDPRIMLIKNDKNRGISYSRNRGNALAHADLIAVVDSDDIYLPERFAKQYAYMQEHPEVSIVGTHAYVIDEEGVRTGDCITYLSAPDEIAKVFFYKGPFLQPTTMYRKNVVTEMGGYRDKYALIDELDLYFRLLLSGKQGANIPEFLVLYRKHAQSTEKHFAQKRKLLFALNREMIARFNPQLHFADYLFIYGWHMLGAIVPYGIMRKLEQLIKKIIY